jgi:hypothetical protein
MRLGGLLSRSLLVKINCLAQNAPVQAGEENNQKSKALDSSGSDEERTLHTPFYIHRLSFLISAYKMDPYQVYNNPPAYYVSPTPYNQYSPSHEQHHLMGYQSNPAVQQINDKPASHPPRTLPSKLKSSWAQSRQLFLWATLASVSFTLTAWFARATLSSAKLASTERRMHLSLSNTLGILRTLQEVTSVLTGVLLNHVLEIMEWGLASSKGGVPALTFLSLSPTTSLIGVLGVAFGRAARFFDRIWAVSRYVPWKFARLVYLLY